MEICEQGLINLARGVLEQLGTDYKLLWHLKEHYDGGNWTVYGADPTSGQRKECDGLYIVMAGIPPIEKSVTGKNHYVAITIDQAIANMEEYLDWHPVIGDKKQWIIKQLREECNDASTIKRIRKALKRIGMLPKASNM